VSERYAADINMFQEASTKDQGEEKNELKMSELDMYQHISSKKSRQEEAMIRLSAARPVSGHPRPRPTTSATNIMANKKKLLRQSENQIPSNQNLGTVQIRQLVRSFSELKHREKSSKINILRIMSGKPDTKSRPPKPPKTI